MDSAAVTELGPGTGTTVWPAAQAAVTSACPGSERVGVPASLTSATSPSSSADMTRGRPRRSTGARSLNRGLRIPGRASKREVTRVSSAAIADTSPRTRIARALRSSRLPIGVPTTYSLLIRPHPAAAPPTSPASGEAKWSNPLEPGADTVGDLRRRTHEARRRRKHLEKRLAVVPPEDPVVEDGDSSAVRRAPDQPPEALLETQRRLRQRQLRE